MVNVVTGYVYDFANFCCNNPMPFRSGRLEKCLFLCWLKNSSLAAQSLQEEEGQQLALPLGWCPFLAVSGLLLSPVLRYQVEHSFFLGAAVQGLQSACLFL